MSIVALTDHLAAYRGLLARRRMSSLWRAEQSGAGLKLADDGEDRLLAALEAACRRLGLPCGGEDVNVDGLPDLELALVCDCFGDEPFGADPTPRLASFRSIRRRSTASRSTDSSRAARGSRPWTMTTWPPSAWGGS